ncbi:ABC transporter ATP-binding protein [bacterium]|nr:ABC transporter ATP-binding protein [bacterium]
MEPVIELKNITISYPGRGKVLDNLNFRLDRGQKVGVKGANGSGKTTLLKIIMGLIKPDSGKVEVFGKGREKDKDFEEVRRKIGFLFQDPDDQLFSPTVEEDIAFGPLNLRRPREEVNRIVEETLDVLGIGSLRKRFSHTLSYGEKRLIAIATVLAMGPEILLFDEPTTALDEDTTERIVSFLRSQEHITYLIVSHDLSFLSSVAEKVNILKEGKLKGQVLV